MDLKSEPDRKRPQLDDIRLQAAARSEEKKNEFYPKSLEELLCKEMSKMEREHAAELRKVESELETLRRHSISSTVKTELEDRLRAESSKVEELEKLVHSRDIDNTNLKASNSNLIKAHRQQIEVLDLKHGKATQAMQRKHAREMEAIQSEHRIEINFIPANDMSLIKERSSMSIKRGAKFEEAIGRFQRIHDLSRWTFKCKDVTIQTPTQTLLELGIGDKDKIYFTCTK